MDQAQFKIMMETLTCIDIRLAQLVSMKEEQKPSSDAIQVIANQVTRQGANAEAALKVRMRIAKKQEKLAKERGIDVTAESDRRSEIDAAFSSELGSAGEAVRDTDRHRSD